MENLRVLVVDDTALYRKLISDVIGEIPNVEVVGSAPNGKIALDKVALVRPDIISLDIEMPVMDGIEMLRQLKKEKTSPLVVMVSSITTEGARVTIEALTLGAFDFITKPAGKGMEDSRQDLLGQLKPVFAAACVHARMAKGKEAIGKVTAPGSPTQGCLPQRSAVDRIRKIASGLPPDIVAIAISTGGPKALGEMIPRLPGNLRVPIVIVQHIPAAFSKELAESLDRKSALSVMEASDGQKIEPGTVYIAPGGKQMKVAGFNGGGNILKITDDPPENNCKPSADYLMRSVASIYGQRALGVIMTGMGADGVLGLKLMKRHGVTIIAQDEQSCVVFGMPAEAIQAGVVDIESPLEKIAAEIINKVNFK